MNIRRCRDRQKKRWNDNIKEWTDQLQHTDDFKSYMTSVTDEMLETLRLEAGDVFYPDAFFYT